MNRISILLVVLITSFTTVTIANEKLDALHERLNNYTGSAKQNHSFSNVIYLVGADGNCQYSIIKDAINAANTAGNSNNYEIRVAYNKTYNENLLINRAHLTLKGGYATCNDAGSDTIGTNRTELDASSQNLPAIILRNSTSSIHINNVYNFEITGGTGTLSNPSGGINIQDNNIEAHFENNFIFGNDGQKGGSIFVEGSDTSIFFKDTLLVLNNAVNGGGLYCDGSEVIMYGDSGVSANNAIGTGFNGSGGGLYLTNGCAFNMFSGTDGGLLDFRGVAGNTANRDGGGIYADAGAQVLLMGYLFAGEFGNNDEPVNITGNKANNSASTRIGGGIYASGTDTDITAYATIINNNEVLSGTASTAGGLYIYEADFSIGRLNSACWDQIKCNQISNNKVNGMGSSDAGIVAFSGSKIDIKNTWISGHSASTNTFLYGQGINTTIEGNVFTDNGGSSIDGNASLMSFWGNSSIVSIANNTFVDNEINTALFRINSSPTMIVHGNIIKEDNNVNILQVASGSSANTQFNCLIVHEDQSFNGNSIFVEDPSFVDEVNGDFHITATSPAIDLCDDSIYDANTKDIDQEARDWDDLMTENLNGTFDAGADEYYPATTADISIAKNLITQAPYYPDTSVEYQILVINNGPDDASNIVIEDNPSGMTISSVLSSSCSSFPCTIPNLNNGSSEIINVTALLRSDEGVFDNSVNVYSQDLDPNTNNNTDNTGNGGTVIFDHVDMQVSSFNLANMPPYHSGQFLTAQVSITNNGPEAARNVVINQTNLSTNIQVINVTGNPCFQWPCNIPVFASGATVNLSLTIQIITGGSFKFGVEVDTDSTDDNVNNNSDTTEQLTSQNSGDLSINSDIVTSSPYIKNQEIEISLAVENNGPNIIGMIEVNLILTNLDMVSVNGFGCTGMPCSGMSLNNGESDEIIIIATIVNAGDFSIETSINSINSYDSNESNNTSTVMGTATADDGLIFKNSFDD